MAFYYKNNDLGPLAVPGPLDYGNYLLISSFPIHFLFITYSISYSITYFILLRFPHYLFIFFFKKENLIYFFNATK